MAGPTHVSGNTSGGPAGDGLCSTGAKSVNPGIFEYGAELIAKFGLCIAKFEGCANLNNYMVDMVSPDPAD